MTDVIKEAIEALKSASKKWGAERGGIGFACFSSGREQADAFSKADHDFAFKVAAIIDAVDVDSLPPAPVGPNVRGAAIRAAAVARDRAAKLYAIGKPAWAEELLNEADALEAALAAEQTRYVTRWGYRKKNSNPFVVHGFCETAEEALDGIIHQHKYEAVPVLIPLPPEPEPEISVEEVAVEALQAVISATQRYLPPDGISKDELISEVLQATDNPRVCRALARVRGR